MSFGWSLGDIFAGIKILWDIYDSVSDGPLNAKLECEQFFEEFSHIIQCLEDWDRKAQVVQDDSLMKLHLQVRTQCEEFISRHILLMQSVNPASQASRTGRATWLRKVPFSREQITALYQQVQWPFERKEVTRLRKKLMLFLNLAIYHVSAATHNVTVENRDILLELRASSLIVASKNLELVSVIIDNLKRLAEPLQSGKNQIDYTTLRQFEQALLPPQPIRTIEARPQRLALPFIDEVLYERENNEVEGVATTSATSSSQDSMSFQKNRTLLSERLQNFRQRSLRTLDSQSSSGFTDNNSKVRQLLERLRDTRSQIGVDVGMPSGNGSEEHLNMAMLDPRNAIQEELEIWDTFEERIGYELQRRNNLVVQATTNTNPSITGTRPIPIPSISPRAMSPMSSPPTEPSTERWLGSPGSPQSNRGSFLHTRSPSTSSTSPTLSVRLIRSLPVLMLYDQSQNQAFRGSIQSYSRAEDGEVICITTTSQDGTIEARHSVERGIITDPETSMRPYLDNTHVVERPKYRVNFLGSHMVKILKTDGHHKTTIRSPPKYIFGNRADYIEFQQLLLSKEISSITDVLLITSRGEPQCRLATIRVLVEPISKTRSILYYRNCRTKEHRGFAEWPINLFKVPKEPSPRCKTIVIESLNGRSLSFSKGALSRRSTQGSITTIASSESATAAHTRLQERSNSKGIKTLQIDFYDPADCHDFWRDFTTIDSPFILPNPALS